MRSKVYSVWFEYHPEGDWDDTNLWHNMRLEEIEDGVFSYRDNAHRHYEFHEYKSRVLDQNIRDGLRQEWTEVEDYSYA